jgi:hypothetical protein
MDEPMQNAHGWARLLGGTTLAGILCGLIGPYGSFVANPINRICFWVSVFWAGAAILWPTTTATLRWAERRAFPLLLAAAVTMLVACIPLAAVAWASCSLFWPVHASGILPQEWYIFTLIIAAPATAAAQLLLGFRIAPADIAAGQRPVVRAQAPEQLPERLLDLVICLQMEDHHVRAFTAGGSQLYFAAMRDVVEQLGPRGIQVHRSWWVANDAVIGSSDVNRSIELLLRNGVKVPVARSRLPAVRSAGWLDTGGRGEVAA